MTQKLKNVASIEFTSIKVCDCLCICRSQSIAITTLQGFSSQYLNPMFPALGAGFGYV